MRNSVNSGYDLAERSTIRCRPTALRLRLGAILTCCLSMLAFSAGFPATGPTPVLDAMKAELGRSMETLKKQPVPPYFLSYEITDAHTFSVHSAFGKLVNSSENRRRQLDIDVRIGDYNIDNTHDIRGSFPGFDFSDRFSLVEVPIEDKPEAIRQLLWYHTDRRYKSAAEAFTKVKTNIQVMVKPEDQSPDFSQEQPEKHFEPVQKISLDPKAWEEKLRKYTAPFAKYGDIYEANAYLSANSETRWFTNSEGSELQTSQRHYRLFVSAFTKAEDGMELPRYESFFAFTPEGLPDDTTVLRAVDKIIQDLHALRKAPVVDPYIGPAILSGRASGVFFHEVFGHRIEGHRQKREEEGQTFKKKINEQLLPETFNVFFDPTLRRAKDWDLIGSYNFDNQGVRARRVPVIEKGVFKSFLMSRSPIEGFARSNGHGRKSPGLRPVARQSNLIVESSAALTRKQLKAKLIEQLKAENKPFGLSFEDIQGGFTITGRMIPNAFNVLPILVYRIYPDGREELVRGVDLIGTPLTAFSKIVAADDTLDIFNGICGAESGTVPVAAVSPAILISQIEVQKKVKSQEKPPVLPAPMDESGSRSTAGGVR
jgi:TldD protein